VRHRRSAQARRRGTRRTDDTGAATDLRRLKVNASPLLYPLWDIDADRFIGLTEDELTRRAASVRADEEFMASLSRAANSGEPVYAPSDHVELQIYGGNFFSDADRELCRQFHVSPWEERPEFVHRFGDRRLKRLARRLIYFESPHLFEEAERRVIADDIAARRRGEPTCSKRGSVHSTRIICSLRASGAVAVATAPNSGVACRRKGSGDPCVRLASGHVDVGRKRSANNSCKGCPPPELSPVL
jgi:hypothetical protein